MTPKMAKTFGLCDLILASDGQNSPTCQCGSNIQNVYKFLKCSLLSHPKMWLILRYSPIIICMLVVKGMAPWLGGKPLWWEIYGYVFFISLCLLIVSSQYGSHCWQNQLVSTKNQLIILKQKMKMTYIKNSHHCSTVSFLRAKCSNMFIRKWAWYL